MIVDLAMAAESDTHDKYNHYRLLNLSGMNVVIDDVFPFTR
ncbi:hypothetical protein [Litchfieldella qijiaojingensis]|nr:hypothetical protein [Halomonas qijiaojingensis]